MRADHEGDRDRSRDPMARRSRCALGASLLRARGLRPCLGLRLRLRLHLRFRRRLLGDGLLLGRGLVGSSRSASSATPSFRRPWALRRRPEEVEERDEAIRPQFAGERASPARGRLGQVPAFGPLGVAQDLDLGLEDYAVALVDEPPAFCHQREDVGRRRRHPCSRRSSRALARSGRRRPRALGRRRRRAASRRSVPRRAGRRGS